MSAFTVTPEGMPDLALPSAIAQSKGSTAVRLAIATGRLPAIVLRGSGEKFIYAVRPEDADVLWGSPTPA
ncbi:Uncharacterised protein [Mycobacteroides abscessus subsp. abscessus]|uniref:hypothetical protein n=1 Tax=Mycobacteroides abscessus TaxID=36809 RepID=UPI0009296B66|nr:hypothetical protein [Mycobacteroides abscessus]SIK25032.1 Uncharacterised protein [Mycobacteroides abscessus subsp. abscessus]